MGKTGSLWVMARPGRLWADLVSYGRIQKVMGGPEWLLGGEPLRLFIKLAIDVYVLQTS